jgi:exosortase
VVTIPTSEKRRTVWAPRVSEIAAVALVCGTLVVAYLSSFRALVAQWNRDPNYSYGFFVIPIAAAIFWNRRGQLDRSKMRPAWWGFFPLLAVVALRVPLYEWNEQYAEIATIPLVLAGLTLALGGWHLLKVALPSIVFLFFMLPLPPSLNALLAQPLQRMATVGSVALLQLLGMPVVADGNVIIIGATPLEVARACNGLSMLLSFITLITATVILIRRPMLERVLLLASAIPIAVISNIIRITATALAFHWLGPETGEKYAHDYAGWAMMPVALLLVWLELRLYSWLFVEVREVDPVELLRRSHGSSVS